MNISIVFDLLVFYYVFSEYADEDDWVLFIW